MPVKQSLFIPSFTEPPATSKLFLPLWIYLFWTFHFNGIICGFKKNYLFVYLFIFDCAGSSLLRGHFSSCSMRGLLIAVASLVAERGF